MNYPLISEYIDAINSAEDNLDKLSNLRPVIGSDGNPVMSSGNFAVVFKMTDGKKDYAIKCFTREQQGREEAYRLIAEELETFTSSFLSPIRYLEKELFVDAKNCDESEFAVLQMDWVDGVTLDNYVRTNLYDTYALEMLAYNFCRMFSWLMTQPFAHGDLKPDNILVRSDGSLVIVDYDGIFVPAMKGQKAREIGSPGYRHPLRTDEQFDEHIDDFALACIALSLKAIALKPELITEFGTADRLLFSEYDLLNPGTSKALQAIQPLLSDPDLQRLLGLFMIALSEQTLANTSYRLARITKPTQPVTISTKATDEDFADALTDKYGVKYSKDGKKLLKGNVDLKEYTIKNGTEVICDRAFSSCRSLQSITIPDSVTSIGDEAFSFCGSLQHITIPDSVTSIGYRAFSGCVSSQSITIPDSVTSIGDSAFSWCRSLQSITIPDSVTSIGDRAFSFCSSLQSITIPDSVTSIGDEAFFSCESLQSITIPDSVTSIGDEAFKQCRSLQSITIPDSVTSIGDGAFSYCNLLLKIESQKFYSDDSCLFDSNKSRLISCHRSNMETYIIPNSVTSIGNSAFSGCVSLQSITIPDSVTSIGKRAFSSCISLQSITISDSVTSIGNWAFYGCRSLQSITIPDSVTSIGNRAFSWCGSLQSIYIPKNTRSKFGKMLPDYKHKLKEIDI